MTSPEQDRLDRLERQVRYILQHLGIKSSVAAGELGGSVFTAPSDVFGANPANQDTAGSPIGQAPQQAAAGYPPELINALQRGKMIDAIKMYRGMTGLGLKEAKDAMEALDRQLRGR